MKLSILTSFGIKKSKQKGFNNLLQSSLSTVIYSDLGLAAIPLSLSFSSPLCTRAYTRIRDAVNQGCSKGGKMSKKKPGAY